MATSTPKAKVACMETVIAIESIGEPSSPSMIDWTLADQIALELVEAADEIDIEVSVHYIPGGIDTDTNAVAVSLLLTSKMGETLMIVDSRGKIWLATASRGHQSWARCLLSCDLPSDVARGCLLVLAGFEGSIGMTARIH